MKHTKNRLLALLLVLAMAIGMVPFAALTVGAQAPEATVIEVAEDGAIENLTWEPAYVGSSSHFSEAWNVVETGWGTSYRLSNIVTVPNAGTTLVWTESASTGAMSKNAFFLTSWKEADGVWTVDLASAKLIAEGKTSTANQIYNASENTMTYVYTTTRDNETIRLGCYGGTESGFAATTAQCPTVYAYRAIFADGSVTGVKWFCGYVGSGTNKEGYVNQIRQLNATYAYSTPIVIPKAGTTVSFTDNASGYASKAAYVFSTWVAGDDGRLELFYGCPGNNEADATEAWMTAEEGVFTYSYTSTYDNEIIRLCYCNNNVIEDVAISYVEDNAANHRPILEAAGYDPDQTGTPYLGAGWSYGAIGTMSNEAAFATENYHVSDIIPVLGKGTTVTITDVISPEAVALEGSNFLGDKYYAIASFYGDTYTGSNSDDIINVNPQLANVKGLTAEELTVAVENGKSVYTYITTEDVEFIRVSVSNVGNFAAGGEETKTGFIAPIIYINVPESENSDVLNGLHVYAVGDSYLEGNKLDRNDVWLTSMATKYGQLAVNYGLNGSTVSSYVTTNNPMVDRYASMVDDPDADIIIFEGGRNDYNQSTPLGTIGDADPKTFYGALQITIDGLLQKYPNALILCMTPWDLTELTTGANATKPATGLRTQDYANAFTAYVDQLDNERVRMIPNADTSVIPVHMTDEYFRAQYCMTATDISHLNAKGMALVQPWIENVIADLYADYLEDCESTGVDFYVNDAVYSFAATDADITIRVPEAPVAVQNGFLGWVGQINGESVAAFNGESLQLSADDDGYMELMTLEMTQVETPVVRFSEGSTGLRYLTAVSLGDYANLATALDGSGAKITFGTLIVPYQYVVDMKGELTHASLEAAEKQSLDVGCNISGGTDWYMRDDANDLGYIAGSIASIKLKNYSKAFTATGYAKLTFADGTVRYVYAANGGRTPATIYDVAYDAMHDRATEYSGIYQYRDAFGTYTPYTTQQLEILEGFLDPVISLKQLTDTAIIVPGTKYYTPTGYQMTAITNSHEDWNMYVNAWGDDEVSVVYVIETTDGSALADGTYGGLLVDGYEMPALYYQGKILIGCNEYSQYY